MQPGILAWLVGVELMMGMLDGRQFQAAFDQHRDHLGDQRGLAGAAPACEADDAHAVIIGSLGRPVPCQARGCDRGSPRPTKVTPRWSGSVRLGSQVIPATARFPLVFSSLPSDIVRRLPPATPGVG